MPRPSKPFNRLEVLTSLTTIREGCNQPDSPFSMERLDEMFPSDEDLANYRESTRPRRKPRPTGGTRETFSSTGKTYIQIPVVIDEDHREQLKALGYQSPKSVARYLSQFVSTTSESGPGGVSFIAKDDRVNGCVTFNANKVVATAIDDLVNQKDRQKRLSDMRDVYNVIVAHNRLQSKLGNEVDSDGEVEHKLRIAAENAGYTDSQTDDVIEQLLAG